MIIDRRNYEQAMWLLVCFAIIAIILITVLNVLNYKLNAHLNMTRKQLEEYLTKIKKEKEQTKSNNQIESITNGSTPDLLSSNQSQSNQYINSISIKLTKFGFLADWKREKESLISIKSIDQSTVNSFNLPLVPGFIMNGF